jgi:hypothetical protein
MEEGKSGHERYPDLMNAASEPPDGERMTGLMEELQTCDTYIQGR